MRRLRLLKLNGFAVKVSINNYDNVPFEDRIQIGKQWKYSHNGYINSSTSYQNLKICIEDAKQTALWFSKNK